LPAQVDDGNVVGMEPYRRKSRPSIARETAPAYGGPAPQSLEFKVTVTGRGRMVLPAEVRQRLAISDGDWLTLILEPDGVIRMLTGRAWANEFARTLRELAGPTEPARSVSDELVAERRREAAKEEREIRALVARRRARKQRA
jgi:AbrB family looped-hinge helix DNA binding protein